MTCFSAIVRTLNASYRVEPYGLGHAATMYPVSAFITHLVYLRGTSIEVDIQRVTVSLFLTSAVNVRCLLVLGRS